MLYAELFLSFLKVGLFSIGGGYAAMPLIESLVVDKYAWLTLSEFGDLVTIAEMTPGPIIVNGATFVGIRVAGIPGAAVATFGSIFPSLIIVTLMSFFYFKYQKLDSMQTVLKTIRPTVVALIASAGLTLFINAAFGAGKLALSNTDFVLIILSLSAFILIRRLKLSPIITIFSCGALYAAANLILEKIITD